MVAIKEYNHDQDIVIRKPLNMLRTNFGRTGYVRTLQQWHCKENIFWCSLEKHDIHFLIEFNLEEAENNSS